MDTETQPDREYGRVDKHGHQLQCDTTDTRERQADGTLEWYERLTTHSTRKQRNRLAHTENGNTAQTEDTEMHMDDEEKPKTGQPPTTR
eukprot:9549537-Prorocentrum_lima.AAC.1